MSRRFSGPLFLARASSTTSAHGDMTPKRAAEFQLLTPCGRIARNRCAGNVAYLRARGGNFYCRGTSGGCDQRHPMTEITFRPL